MGNQRIVVNAERSRFYCWSWDRWKSLHKLRRCFEEGCRRMYEPEGEHLRKVISNQLPVISKSKGNAATDD